MNRRLRRVLAAGAVWALLAVPVVPVRAEWIVFDPRNFAQNVLTAARELQQVNNEIQSLENQAQMLINQARNLASLPFSALQPLEQSIAQTEQLLAQAQNIDAPPNWWTPLLSSDGSGKVVEWPKDGVNSRMSSGERRSRCS
jgi:type IV secretion system protein TrbJ